MTNQSQVNALLKAISAEAAHRAMAQVANSILNMPSYNRDQTRNLPFGRHCALPIELPLNLLLHNQGPVRTAIALAYQSMFIHVCTK